MTTKLVRIRKTEVHFAVRDCIRKVSRGEVLGTRTAFSMGWSNSKER